MSKKLSISSKVKGKKELNEQDMALFPDVQPEQPPSTSRKRLKKLAQVNFEQEILPPQENETERLDEQQKQEYVQFQMKDDDDLKREKEEQEREKQNKKLKGNQKLQNFFANRIKEKPMGKKETKSKEQKVQLTLHQMALIKKQKRQRRKSSEDFIVSDNALESKQEEREAQNRRNVERYKQFNGTMYDEKKLLQKALQLSLTAASEKKNNIEYPIKDSQINKRLVLQKKKEENISAVKQKKEVKKKTIMTKEKDQKKEGPLADFVIAFTGEFLDFDKMAVIEVCMQLGAECPKSLTKKCNLLIQGDCVLDQFKRKKAQLVSETDKSISAVERGIQIVPPEQLDNFFIKHTGFCLDHHLSLNKVRPNLSINSTKDEGNFVQIKNDTFKQVKEEKRDIYIPSSNSQKVETMRLTNTNLIANHPHYMDIQRRQYKHQDNRLWTEKFKPTCLQEVVGQGSQIKGLREWLQAWEDIHMKGNKREVREIKGNVGSINSKAALLSGDPGIGKTTTARLLAAQYNYLVSEFNASDVRNKSGINLLESGSFSLDQGKNLQRTLIIMDEVDGMSSGDRGGVASIIQMIKNSKVPIICICNDRQSQKIRSLAGHCLDIRFHKPAKQMVAKRLREILNKQGGSGEDRALEMLVETFQNDMRQILSYLELIFRTVSKRITVDALSSRGRHAKDSAVMINHFEAARTLLNRTQFQGMKISARVQCFFIDSDMVPLMIHQNILSCNKKRIFDREDLRSMVQGVEGMVLGDMLDRTIRKEQEWGLMPSYAFMNSVYAPEKITDSCGFPAFPAWLGKFSSERKNKRLARELKDSFFPVTLCANWRTIKHQYSPLILNQLVQLLKQQNVELAVMLMQDYNITPATLSQHLVSMVYSTDKNSNPLGNVTASTKSKLTRLYNKRHQDAKLRAQGKGPKAKVQHIKYDPLMEVGEEQAEDVQQPVEQQSGQVEGKVKKSKGGKKK